MRLENSFEVQAPPERAWALLLDVPRVVPCMPGAELTEVVADDTYKATMAVKLGPISLKFATDVKLEETDETAKRVRMSAKAKELRGRGGGSATIESTLTAVEGGTRVDIVTDMALTGAIAQYGGGIVQDVSSQMVGKFADCLAAQLVAEPPAAEAAPAPAAHAATPVSGLSLGAGAVARAVARAFGRLLRRR
jgi:carbon monoxide dehydrogenase subunit G